MKAQDVQPVQRSAMQCRAEQAQYRTVQGGGMEGRRGGGGGGVVVVWERVKDFDLQGL